MRSHEVLREASDEIGVKALAAKLRLSTALVYKWCQDNDPDDPDTSGARNPLDRVSDIVEATGDVNVLNWLCNEAGGFYVANPQRRGEDLDTELLINTQRLVEEFSRLLSTVTRSVEDDGQIDAGESKKIRRSWERRKTTAEEFSVACERGMYHHQDRDGD
ncbi:MAG: hypothetical protein GY778_22765 [bacterium]|nr:hypothetical protein [bacterium]